MAKIRQDLINKELSKYNKKYKNFNLHNSLIKKLKNHYNCIEYAENYYNFDDDLTEEERLKKLNYQEIYYKGNWEYSQQEVNNTAIDILKWIKKQNIGLKNRVYISINDRNCIYIYF